VKITGFRRSEVELGCKLYVTMELNSQVVTSVEVKFWFYGYFNYEISIEVKLL